MFPIAMNIGSTRDKFALADRPMVVSKTARYFRTANVGMRPFQVLIVFSVFVLGSIAFRFPRDAQESAGGYGEERQQKENALAQEDDVRKAARLWVALARLMNGFCSFGRPVPSARLVLLL